ncbi:hypothetical protein [Kribbella sp. VKM Ac-2568]|uniref:hypothetical protein n=1 Tax=Kribbella sp. VKM Ac-2568 TaxID=2512219 RepID=UPI0010DA8012|nr:hypothetical protein [Kribbella sp. VKM Ac-2568]TCM45055.1 cobalamin-independent synthase [Kribbella sp. VKM Ac-2568]
MASYFDRLGEALPVLAKAPVEGLALDFTGPAAANLDALASVAGLRHKRLVAGVVNGRNIWINDLSRSLSTLATLMGIAGQVDVSSSCSLLHVPLDVAAEKDIDPEVLAWLAFARQKTAEIVTLTRGITEGTEAIEAELTANRAALEARAGSALTNRRDVRARVAAVTEDIHSPRVPGTPEIVSLLRKGLAAIPAERLWVNPDCGLKTRGWPEVRDSLQHLVDAAHEVRNDLPS